MTDWDYAKLICEENYDDNCGDCPIRYACCTNTPMPAYGVAVDKAARKERLKREKSGIV